MLNSANILNVVITNIEQNGIYAMVEASWQNKTIYAITSTKNINHLKLKVNMNAKMIFKSENILLAKGECATRVGVENEFFGVIKTKLQGSFTNFSCKLPLILDYDSPSKVVHLKMLAYDKIITITTDENTVKAMDIKDGDEVVAMVKADDIMIGICE